MMGEPVGRQDRLFYEFCLEDLVPADHLLRTIDTVLDLSWLRAELKPHYSDIGRPSICPELMIRMLLVGYCYSIRSERRLCQEVKLNLAYRWICRLVLENRVPDHSRFSVNRHGRFRKSNVSMTVRSTGRTRNGQAIRCARTCRHTMETAIRPSMAIEAGLMDMVPSTFLARRSASRSGASRKERTKWISNQNRVARHRDLSTLPTIGLMSSHLRNVFV